MLRAALFAVTLALLSSCAEKPSKALPATDCPWKYENASEPQWRQLSKRGESNVYASYSTRCVGTDWVALKVSPLPRDDAHPKARSTVETWLLRCEQGVGAWTATSYYSEEMGQGTHLGTADGFARYEDLEKNPQVSELCRFLANNPPMEYTAE
jgi:hypothetical protein